ncbi:efflux transporter outer membrane subunit [Acidisoma sp. C75]
MSRLAPLAALLLAGCMVGPNYHRPAALVPGHYKEMPGWAQAAPADAAPKGDWWTGFNDPLLDQLEPQVAVSNQTVQAELANYLQARALVQEAEGQLFPTLGLSGAATRSRVGSTQGTAAIASSASVSGTANWELDLWGQIRRQVQESAASAQEAQAVLANATLSEQALLATDLIDLRISDAQINLLQQTVKAYQEALRITQNQGAAGVAAPSDVITARATLEAAQSSLINAGIARAEAEHAMAVLAGRLPEDLSVAHGTSLPSLPPIPVGVPSSLLERRPDIAADERAVAAANAAIGVAVAAYYPTITLSASGGFSGSPIGALFSVANQVWSLGTDAALNLFEGGARSAAVRAARASYEASVATYRGAVLTAFQQVEDQLAALRILAQQEVVANAAVGDATQAVQIALNEYEAGTAAYTTVTTAQATLLNDQESLLSIRSQRLLAAVSLIEDLGGGWSAAMLETAPGPDILP